MKACTAGALGQEREEKEGERKTEEEREKEKKKNSNRMYASRRARRSLHMGSPELVHWRGPVGRWLNLRGSAAHTGGL